MEDLIIQSFVNNKKSHSIFDLKTTKMVWLYFLPIFILFDPSNPFITFPPLSLCKESTSFI